jgi:hypothetical protein
MASKELIQAIAATAELCGAKISETAAMMLVHDLAAYPEPQVFAALSKVRKTGKRFSLGSLVDAINQNDGRPGGDEAWAMLPFDENTTVVWTDEMRRAWAIASPLLEMGDKFGARRAFVEAYEKEVEKAREAGATLRWEVSLGLDPRGREAPLRAAVERGQLGMDQLPVLLPAPDMTQSPIAQIAFAATATPLLEGDGVGKPTSNEVARETLRKLKEAMFQRKDGGNS